MTIHHMNIDRNERHTRIIRAKFMAKDYKRDMFTYHYVFMVDNQRYVYSSVELMEAGII